MKIAVFGASGTIGRALVAALAAEHELVAVSRRPHPDTVHVRWVAADVLELEDVRNALASVEVAYYLVHSLGTRDFERRDRIAARNVARAAAEAGVSQLVYLGGLGDDAPDLSPHLRSRLESERELASGPVPLTTLRAAIVVGHGSAGFETIVGLVDRLPLMLAPRWISVPTQPVALGDVVRYLVGVAGREVALRRNFDIGGPEVLTYREMIERVARLRGRRPRIVEVPVLSPWLSAWWLHLVTPVTADVARPLIEGLKNPTVVREQTIRELVQFDPTSFDDAARAALAERPRLRSTHQTDNGQNLDKPPTIG